jgi:hypothetical protein
MGRSDPGAERLEVNPDVVFRRVETEVVLVKIATNEIFALNPTGARTWELLVECGDISETVAGLAEEFDAPEAVLQDQVEAFVAELRRQGFLLASM